MELEKILSNYDLAVLIKLEINFEITFYLIENFLPYQTFYKN